MLLLKKYADETSIDIAIHVDDDSVTTDILTRLESLLLVLEDKFRIIKITRGIRHEYLSMVLDFDKDSFSVSISMPKYTSRFLDEYPLHRYNTVLTPHDKDLFDLSKVDQKLFHSSEVT